MSRPYAPLRDVAAFVQTDSLKESTPPLVVCYGLGREVLPVYYPASIPAENATDIENVLKRAKTEERSLYFIYGYESFNRTMLPEGFRLLDDRSRYKEVKAFGGIEPDFCFRVLKAL